MDYRAVRLDAFYQIIADKIRNVVEYLHAHVLQYFKLVPQCLPHGKVTCIELDVLLLAEFVNLSQGLEGRLRFALLPSVDRGKRDAQLRCKVFLTQQALTANLLDDSCKIHIITPSQEYIMIIAFRMLHFNSCRNLKPIFSNNMLASRAKVAPFALCLLGGFAPKPLYQILRSVVVASCCARQNAAP